MLSNIFPLYATAFFYTPITFISKFLIIYSTFILKMYLFFVAHRAYSQLTL